MRTIEQIAQTIDISKLPDYRRQLVYVDYRDRFDESSIEKLLRGEYPDDTDGWISDRQWESACDLADELFREACSGSEFGEHEDEWGPSNERYALIDELREIDTSTPYRDLMSNTGVMLFRCSPPEDDMVWLGDIIDTAEKLHAELGLADELLPTVRTIWPEIEGYTLSGGAFGASIVFSANPGDLWVGEGAMVEITDPFLWLCNPWAGNGYGEVAEGVTVALNINDIHTDKAEWGYSADETFGGLCLPDSTITIKEATTA
jgi:hypothetical protein